jgi:hypothetical protein
MRLLLLALTTSEVLLANSFCLGTFSTSMVIKSSSSATQVSSQTPEALQKSAALANGPSPKVHTDPLSFCEKRAQLDFCKITQAAVATSESLLTPDAA